MLSDRDLKGAIASGDLAFMPELGKDQIGPASIDLKLGDTFLVFRRGNALYLDPKQSMPRDYLEKIERDYDQPFVLHPGTFVLAATKEYVKLSDKIVVRVEGKSTIARMGILVHTAGFVDPGYEGTITLEISNHSGLPVLLYPEMYICQIAAHWLSSPAEVPYNKRKKSNYRKDRGPAAAKTKNLFPK